MGDIADLAKALLKLGFTAVGGPAVHLNLMEREFVERRSWISKSEFADLIGASNLIPGPGSTEVALMIGLRRAGWLGLLMAGACFIGPAVLLVMALAWAYTRFGSSSPVQFALYGAKPVVLAVVAVAVIQLFQKLTSGWAQRSVLILAAIAGGLGVNTLVILLTPAAVFCLSDLVKFKQWKSIRPLLFILGGAAAFAGLSLLISKFAPFSHAHPTVLSLFAYFLTVGSVLYGGGYVLLAFLDQDLVFKLHWLSHGVILDATAIGQITPGPVFTTATFIGFITAGWEGAMAATVGIFIPAFFFAAFVLPLIPRIRQSSASSEFLKGVNAAAIGLMAVVLAQLGPNAVHDVVTGLFCVSAFFLSMKFRVNPALLLLAGACVGIGFRFFAHPY